MTHIKDPSSCSQDCQSAEKIGQLSCNLTSAELQKRKESVVASLMGKMLEKRELKDGYAFMFPGTDEILDEVNEFVKTERACCDFFTFTLSVSRDATWLELTGPEGVKEFIKAELEL